MHINWSKVAHYAETFAPLILAETPLAPLASFVAIGITTAQKATEGDTKMTNKQKLQLAIDEIHNGVEATNSQAGKQILSQPDVDTALAAGINAVVATINLKHDTTAAINTVVPAVDPTAAADATDGKTST